MKNLTWQNPEQLFVAQELINKVKSKCCGIKVKKVIIRGDVEIPLFKGVFNRTNLSDIHWYGDILKLHTFLSHMVSNESTYHHDYDAITIHIRKNSDAIEVTQWLEKYRFRNDENGVEAKFKIVKDL